MNSCSCLLKWRLKPLSESKEIHKFREKLRYAFRKDHPDWSPIEIKEAIAGKLAEFRNSSKKVQKWSESGSEVQNPVPNGSENKTVSQTISEKKGGAGSSGRRVRSSKKELEYPRIWLKLYHSMDKSQIILKESIDGISWKTTAILTKDQPFERNGLIISATWHKGSVTEADSR